jgi:hypothetical protein
MKFINQDIGNDNVDKKVVITSCYNKLGKLISENNEVIFAQMSSIQIDNKSTQNKFLVLVHNNKPYDPYGIDSHRESNLPLVLKAVNKETFTYYLKYLESKNSLYMTRAQRSFINV